MPGMAEQSTQCQPEPLPTWVLKRRNGVGRTTGMIAAMVPQKRADQILIRPDESGCCALSDQSSPMLTIAGAVGWFSPCSPWRPRSTTRYPTRVIPICVRGNFRVPGAFRAAARRTCFFDIARPSLASAVSLRRASVVKQESADLTGWLKPTGTLRSM